MYVIRVMSKGSARKFGQSLIPVQPFTMMVAGIIKCRPFLDEFLIHTIEQVVQSFFESFYGLLHLGSMSTSKALQTYRVVQTLQGHQLSP